MELIGFEPTGLLPENWSSFSESIIDRFGYITIELEVDPVDLTIVNVSGTLLPFLGEKILHKALLGNKFEEAIQEAIEQLDRRFFNVTRRAVIAALEDMFRWHKKSFEKIAARKTV